MICYSTVKLGFSILVLHSGLLTWALDLGLRTQLAADLLLAALRQLEVT